MKLTPILALALVLLAGCAARAPSLQLVALPAAPVASAAPQVNGLVLTLRRVALPEYLQSREVRFRDGAAGVTSWPGSVWAERVEVGATRELAIALRRALPAVLVCDSACAEAMPTRRVLAVDVVKLDVDRAARRLDSELRWSLLDPRSVQTAPVTGVVARSLPLDGDSAEAAARGLSALLGAAAEDVAQTLAARAAAGG
ncbi:PqiC family protein [Derxia gummosa]|uniref:PqiC family protein n=1 Tax=Derxia gummosa DSM 723 TaxID=1121388 RepID=A0A8B6X0Y7_9BURK|nr:ABC-type transport auxiliary lipoprotein family protein [Derxia gummosa]